MKKNPGRLFTRNSTRELSRLHGIRSLPQFLHAYYDLSHIDPYIRVLMPIRLQTNKTRGIPLEIHVLAPETRP